jgi:hypothetical protein
MLREYCETCGNLESNHQATQAESERYLSIANDVIANISEEHGSVIDDIVYSWRSHTLPTCDPLSIS